MLQINKSQITKESKVFSLAWLRNKESCMEPTRRLEGNHSTFHARRTVGDPAHMASFITSDGRAACCAIHASDHTQLFSAFSKLCSFFSACIARNIKYDVHWI